MQLDIFQRLALDDKEEALNRVMASSPDWFVRALAFIGRLECWEGTGEDIRFLLESNEIGPGKNQYVYGALVNHAKRKKLLFETGRRTIMKGDKSHGRKTDVLRTR